MEECRDCSITSISQAYQICKEGLARIEWILLGLRTWTAEVEDGKICFFIRVKQDLFLFSFVFEQRLGLTLIIKVNNNRGLLLELDERYFQNIYANVCMRGDRFGLSSLEV